MSKPLKLDDLLSVQFEEGELEKDRSGYRMHSKRNAMIIGYLLGVKDEHLELLPDDPKEYYELKSEIEKNNSAVIVRHLNNIRSNLMLCFKLVSETIRVTSANFTPLYKMEYFEEDFKALKKFGIDISTGRSDIIEYINIINNEIAPRIENVKPLFPEWLDFRHIRTAFTMPHNIDSERRKYQNHQSCYPYKRYFNWKNPQPMGNILVTDERILDILYENGGAYFVDGDRVVGVSERVKDGINDFIELGKRIRVYIDGENTDPYRFASAIYSLTQEETDKIEKIIVYYDAKYSSKAWTVLKHFTGGIEVETVPVERLLDEKSLVDHKLVAGVSKAVYQEGVDSIILCSSDSDFWSVIQDVSARYLVMVETDKCGADFKEVLREHDIFYCYLDRFQTPTDDKFFDMVIQKELQRQIDGVFNVLQADGNELLKNALRESRAVASRQERENLFNRFVKGLKVEVSKDGIITVKVPE